MIKNIVEIYFGVGQYMGYSFVSTSPRSTEIHNPFDQQPLLQKLPKRR